MQRFPQLGSLADVRGAATVAEAYQLASLLTEADHTESDGGGLRVVNSGTIDRYEHLWGRKLFRYLGKSYLRPIVPADRLAELSSTRLAQARTPKLIVAGMTRSLECVFDSAGKLLAAKSTAIIFSSQLELRYLLAVLNSDIVSRYYAAVFGGNKLQGGYLRVGPPQLRMIPIPFPRRIHAREAAICDELIRLVDRRLETEHTDRLINTRMNDLVTDLYQ
jgi:hypothetical protein